MSMEATREVLPKGRISTVDLLVLTSLNKLLLIMKILFMRFTKKTTLIRRSTVLGLPLQLAFPGAPDNFQSLFPNE